MRTLDRYVGISFIQGYVIVVMVLLPIFSFLVFVDQLEDVGKGSYGTLDGLVYVLQTAPGILVDLSPVAVFLGGIVSLGRLAAGSELVAMRAAGVSSMRLGGAVIKAAALIMLALALLSQYVVPPLDQNALKGRSLAISGTGTLLKGQGFWSRDGRHYLNVGRLEHGRVPLDIDIYEFNQQGRLLSYVHAGRANVRNGTQWRLHDVDRKTIDPEQIRNERMDSLVWESFLAKKQIRALELPATSLSPTDLYQYVRYLRRTGQVADRIELTFWQQVLLPLYTVAMGLFSLPFVFGPLRSASFGKRLTTGAVVGVALVLLNQIVTNLGLVVGLSAPLIATIPIALVVLITAVLMRRAA